MKVLIAVDKFKGSLTAAEVCESIRQGVLTKYPDADVEVVPLADGGEGTAELLTFHTKGKTFDALVTGPLPENVKARYGVTGNGRTAFIESAQASGLQLLPTSKRNPLFTSTFGTGELISEAISHGVSEVVLGIGGTATNDAGIGMAAALGYRFLDEQGRSVDAIGKNLSRIRSIIPTNKRMSEVEFIALCDVDNPLYGPRGAAFTYGPQKGANEHAVKLLDEGLINFERVVRQSLGREANFPGAGAGGGLASGASVFLHAEMRKGMEYIAQVTELESKIRSCDLVITGEGKIDTQTLSGKVVATVASLAKRFGKKVTAVCGICMLREIEMRKLGVDETISLVDAFTTVEQAMTNADSIIRQKVGSNL